VRQLAVGRSAVLAIGDGSGQQVVTGCAVRSPVLIELQRVGLAADLAILAPPLIEISVGIRH